LAILDRKGLKKLKTVIAAGEKLSKDIAIKWMSGIKLFNAYGPTESTVGVSAFNVNELKSFYSSTPIGKPINNVGIYVLDQGLNVVPLNVVGEIKI
jgi:non-ribosomal peptide synthetase component F